MARHTRIALAIAATIAGVMSGTLASAAGDQQVTGGPAAQLSLTEDGVPFERSGAVCKAGMAGGKSHHRAPDQSDY